MSVSNDQTSQQRADREKRWVAFTSVLAAVFLTLMKLIVGITTGSLGILSEAAHSGLDLVAALVTYFAVRISGRPADSRYTYGYGKVENLSALFETFLLLVTCVWIIYEAIQRLFFKSVEVEASFWAFLVMGISILVDIGRSRALSKAAKKYDSQALEADALHFSTDIWSSSVVILGLFLVLLSERLEMPGLVKADALAALGVAGIVVVVSLQLGKKTVTALLDAVPAGLRDEVTRAVKVPGVKQVQRVRVRRSGPETFVDVTLTVVQEAPLEQAQLIASQAEEAARRLLPGADVLVYVRPERSAVEDIYAAVRRLANRLGAHVHSIRVYENGGGERSIELHMEVSELLRLEEAHEKATALEVALSGDPFRFSHVVVHIEPVGEASAKREAQLADEIKVMQILEDLQHDLGIPCHPHEITVHRMGGEISVSFHCLIDGEVSIQTAHKYTEQIERLLRSKMPELGRVVIHTEPLDAEESEQYN